MNSELTSAARCYGLYDNNNIIGFIGVLHQPHAVNRKIKRVTRLVILPDYQGIGLGTKLLETIADEYTSKGYDFSIKTSAKNLIHALSRNGKWVLISYCASSSGKRTAKIDRNRKSLRSNCKMASFFYKR